jgi:hypothetical protein
MRLPRWYKIEALVWAFTGLPLYVLTALYAGRWWPIPDPPYEYLPWWDWLIGFLIMYHAILVLPVALLLGWRKAHRA